MTESAERPAAPRRDRSGPPAQRAKSVTAGLSGVFVAGVVGLMGWSQRSSAVPDVVTPSSGAPIATAVAPTATAVPTTTSLVPLASTVPPSSTLAAPPPPPPPPPVVAPTAPPPPPPVVVVSEQSQ